AVLGGKRIAEQFPALSPVRAEVLGVGWDNIAMRVNSAFVFRFPRREIGATLLEGETRVMPVLAPLLPLPVPDHRFAGNATEKFPWPFAGYRMIPGQTADRANLSNERRNALARPLARFLKSLHSNTSVELERDNLGRFDMPHRKRQSKDRLMYIAKHRLIDDIAPLMEIVESAPFEYAARADAVVHGDLYSRHLLVDETGTLAGVIDWGDVHRGDRATDLAIAFTFLPPAARADFF